MTAHTPGPWSAEPNPVFGPSIRVTDEQDVTVATVWVNPLDPKAWGAGNARLIAAAPDLLEAVTLLQAALTQYRLRDVKKRYSLCVADAAASAAIAKAEGRDA